MPRIFRFTYHEEQRTANVLHFPMSWHSVAESFKSVNLKKSSFFISTHLSPQLLVFPAHLDFQIPLKS